MDDLLTCLKSGNTTCTAISTNEMTHLKSWHNFTEAYAKGEATMPVTAILVAIHNMITEGVAPGWIPKERIGSFCPHATFQGLRSGLFADDEKVQNYVLPSYAAVPGVPGLSARHPAVSCQHR